MKFVSRYIQIVVYNPESSEWLKKDAMADVFGHLALHRGIRDRQKWIISHVPTGLCFPHEFDDRAIARTALGDMLDGYSWNFKKTADTPIGADKYFVNLVKRLTGKPIRFVTISELRKKAAHGKIVTLQKT